MVTHLAHTHTHRKLTQYHTQTDIHTSKGMPLLTDMRAHTHTYVQNIP